MLNKLIKLIELRLVILFFPLLFIVTAINGYMPTPDEVIQIQGAFNISKGFGYMSNYYTNDLSDFNLKFITQWPIGYSFILSKVIKFGIPIEFFLKTVKLIFIYTSIFFWVNISQKFLFLNYYKNIFLIFAIFISLAISISLTDLIVFCLTAILINFLFFLNNTKNIYYYRLIIKLALFGTIAGCLILIKYSAISSIIFCILIIIVYLKKSREYILFFSFILPIFFIIFLYNYHSQISSKLNYQSYTFFLGDFEFIYKFFYEFLKSLLIDSNYIGKYFVSLISIYFGFNSSSSYILVLVFVLSTLILISFKIYQFSLGRELINFYIIFTFSLFIFIGLISINFINGNWIPAQEGRYFQCSSPFLILIILYWLENFTNLTNKLNIFFNKVFMTILVLFLILYIAYYNHILYNITFESSESYNFISNTSLFKDKSNVIIFADDDNFLYLNYENKYKIFPWNLVNHLKYIKSDKPIIIYMICTRKSTRFTSQNNNSCANSFISNYATTNNFEFYNTGNRNTIYWKNFSTGFSSLDK